MATSDSLKSGSASLSPKVGDRITVTYADRDFGVICITPRKGAIHNDMDESHLGVVAGHATTLLFLMG